jgi:hypothetical protein
MAYLLAGPFIAMIGIVAVFFVLRRKSVEKHSMYSARRSQIEHKVRAARQRTLAGHAHVEKPAAPPAETTAPLAPMKVQPTIKYEVSAFEAPPAAPPAAPPPRPKETFEPLPWEQSPAPPEVPAPRVVEGPAAEPEPFTAEPAQPFAPAPEQAPMPEPTQTQWATEPSPAEPFPATSEPAWTPAATPAEPLPPAATVAPAASAAASGGWSIVTTTKESAVGTVPDTKKKHTAAPGSSWELASGDAPGTEAEEAGVSPSRGTLVAAAQYGVLVVGLVMVLIGVLVMVANSHVT